MFVTDTLKPATPRTPMTPTSCSATVNTIPAACHVTSVAQVTTSYCGNQPPPTVPTSVNPVIATVIHLTVIMTLRWTIDETVWTFMVTTEGAESVSTASIIPQV